MPAITKKQLQRLEPFVHGLGKAILRELMEPDTMLNRHPALSWTRDDPTPRQVVGISSGWAWTDTVRMHWCPKCGSFAGFHCQSPNGREVWPPHAARVQKLTPEQIQACATSVLSSAEDAVDTAQEE